MVAAHVGEADETLVAVAPASFVVFIRAASPGKSLFRRYAFAPLAGPVVVSTGRAEDAVTVLVVAILGGMAVVAVFVGAPAEVPESGEVRGNGLVNHSSHGCSNGFDVRRVPRDGEVCRVGPPGLFFQPVVVDVLAVGMRRLS